MPQVGSGSGVATGGHRSEDMAAKVALPSDDEEDLEDEEEEEEEEDEADSAGSGVGKVRRRGASKYEQRRARAAARVASDSESGEEVTSPGGCTGLGVEPGRMEASCTKADMLSGLAYIWVPDAPQTQWSRNHPQRRTTASQSLSLLSI